MGVKRIGVLESDDDSRLSFLRDKERRGELLIKKKEVLPLTVVDEGW
jgi:hypothetical protein